MSYLIRGLVVNTARKWWIDSLGCLYGVSSIWARDFQSYARGVLIRPVPPSGQCLCCCLWWTCRLCRRPDDCSGHLWRANTLSCFLCPYSTRSSGGHSVVMAVAARSPASSENEFGGGSFSACTTASPYAMFAGAISFASSMPAF